MSNLWILTTLGSVFHITSQQPSEVLSLPFQEEESHPLSPTYEWSRTQPSDPVASSVHAHGFLPGLSYLRAQSVS